ncbi:MAG: type IV secretion system DNA-binding domain-containing protein, partial [bacterium]|nr:type IV secretion system DNA-binding domain-containing protein [bacterium]
MDPIEQLIQLLFRLISIALGLGFVAGAVWLGAYAGVLYSRHKKREERSLDSVLLEIAVPRDNEVKIDAAEQMFGAIYSIKKSGWKMRFDSQDTISFEIVARTEDIRFYVWCPRRLKDLIEKQVHGAYTDADIKEVPEYNIFTENGAVAYSSLQLRNENFYPIKNFKDMATDPLSSLSSVLAKMGEGEGAAIQVLISPADNEWKGSGKGFLSKTKRSESDPEKASYKIDAKTMESIDNKLAKPGFETTVRFVICSPDESSAKTHLSNLKASFEQFSGDLNGFKGRKIRYKASFITDFLYRYHPLYQSYGNKKMVLNSEELATIFHFPNKQITTPHIFWLNAKRAPAPAQIATEGMFIGTSTYRGVSRPVFIQETDRRRHMYIIGKTGTGKSELLKDMIMQDVRAGKGVCFMDPHGDAVEDILKMIPPERAEDVIYFDPSDIERPVGINLLEAKDEQQMHFVATAILNLMYKLYDPYRTGIIGPR